MDSLSQREPESNEHPREEQQDAQANASQPSLEQLLAGARDVFTATADHVREIGELAFMEFELAISSFRWWLLAVALCAVCGIMTFTLIAAAAIVAFTTIAAPPIAILLVMACVTAGIACCLLLWLKVLSRKMAFNTLRSTLLHEPTRPQAGNHVDIRR